jgi:[ribosomal protein S18]-alanine N-acetyltransferase
MPVAIRLAETRDAEPIAALSRRAIEDGLPWSWTPSRVNQAIADPNINVVVARISGAVVGFGVMEYEHDSAHLLLFAVDAPDRNRGLGSQLLHWLEEVATTAGIRKVHLEARTSNTAAISFYKKHGYVESSEVLGMYFGFEDGKRFVKQL